MLPDYNIIAGLQHHRRLKLFRWHVILRLSGCAWCAADNIPEDAMKFEKVIQTTIGGERPARTKLSIINDDARAWDQLALRAAVIAAQARWRQAGEVPAEATVTASELVARRGRKPIDPVERAKADPVYRRRLMEAIVAMEQS